MSRFHPPSPLAGRLATQSLLFALGEGTFMTGSAVFFTQIVGLSAAQVGLGLTIAGVAAFVGRPAGGQAGRPLRAEADVGAERRRAGRRCSRSGRSSTASRGYVAMAVTMEVVGSLGGAAHGAYTIDVLPPRRAGEVAGLHVLRAQRRLHPRLADRRHRAGVRLQHRAARRCRGSPPSRSWSTPPRSCGCRTPPTTSARRRSARAEAARTRTDAQLRAGWPPPSSSACSGPTRCCSTS